MRHAPPPADFPHFPVTAGTCILASAVSIASFTGKNVEILECNYRVMSGEVWRLLTSALVHGDWFHLIFNLYWTWVFGSLAEYKWGSLRTLGVFAYLALVSGGLEYAFLNGGVGLSGVGYGLFGLFWAMKVLDRDSAVAVDKSTTQLFVIWFFICVAGTWFGTMTIANIAHGMGAVAGAVLGKAIIAFRKTPRMYYRVMTGVLVIFTLVCATLARPYVNFSKRLSWDLQQLAFDQYTAGDLARATKTLSRAEKRPVSQEEAKDTLEAFRQVKR